MSSSSSSKDLQSTLSSDFLSTSAKANYSDQGPANEQDIDEEIKKKAAQLEIDQDALREASGLFRGYRGVSSLHADQMGLIYCKYVIGLTSKSNDKKDGQNNNNDEDDDDDNEEQQPSVKGKKTKHCCSKMMRWFGKISKKFCSTRYPLFGKKGLDEYDDFDITEDKECCCGKIRYRTHRRIENNIEYLRHHRVEFLSMKLLIELARMKHNIGYRMYSNLVSNRLTLFLCLIMIPVLAFLSMVAYSNHSEFISRGSNDIFYDLARLKYLYLVILILSYYLFVCLSIVRMNYTRQIYLSAILMMTSAYVLALYSMVYYEELEKLPLKVNYRMEQFRQAFSEYDISETARHIVDRTQRDFRCCAITSFKNYFDDINFYETKSQNKTNDEKDNKDVDDDDEDLKMDGDDLANKGNDDEDEETLEFDPRMLDSLQKKKIPASCFNSKISHAYFLIKKSEDITQFGFGDGCAEKIFKYTSTGFLSNSQVLIFHVVFSLIFLTLMPYSVYFERNREVLMFLIAETIRNRGQKVLDANSELLRMYSIECEAPGILNKEIGPQLTILYEKIKHAEAILKILKIRKQSENNGLDVKPKIK